LPSAAEAFGLVLVEAMACGLPLIASQAPGPAAIVQGGKTGWLIPSDNEEALVDSLVAAASDPTERQARARRAHAESRHYGWPTIARRVALLYQELAPQEARARGAEH
jgi:glycosyltransferase involved in cell wall biosynthesis